MYSICKSYQALIYTPKHIICIYYKYNTSNMKDDSFCNSNLKNPNYKFSIDSNSICQNIIFEMVRFCLYFEEEMMNLDNRNCWKLKLCNWN